MHTIDVAVIVIYLIVVILVGLRMGRPGKGNASSRDYFLGSSDLPWWAVCFSVVATETSTLTVIGVPAVAYLGSFVFLQLAIGYLIGRAIVSVTLLPAYFRGEQATAYEFLGTRFGSTMQRTGSIVFLITRLLADGVGLFATAIPLKVIADIAGFEATYLGIILCIGIATIVYTFFGGIRAVVWMDVIQMLVYVGGGILAAFLLIQALPGDWVSDLREAGKLQLIDWGSNRSLSENLTQPYYILCAICLLYTSPSPRDATLSRMPSSA